MDVHLEVPRFGEFARQLANVRSVDIEACLSIQKSKGGRIGDLLQQQDLVSREQLLEVLRRQARWVANMRSRDVSASRFPLSTPLSLCMPCYNEADVIVDCLEGACAVLPEFLEEFEIIVVDDGSQDATAELVERCARQDDRIRLIRHDTNQGYGAAVTTGLRAARGEWICFTDGDGQFNLLDLPQLLVWASEFDVVVGYRYQRADHGLRRFNAHGWNWLIRCMLGVRVRDLDCAFKLFHRRVVERLQLTSQGACINAEILAQCFRGGLTIHEVPVNHFPRYNGKATGANFNVVAKAFRELPRLWPYRATSMLSNGNGESASNGEVCRAAVVSTHLPHVANLTHAPQHLDDTRTPIQASSPHR